MPLQTFDRIARPYRWLEYLTFGRALERCRELQLDRMHDARRVLVLGDGDGRFTAALLARHRGAQVVAVDSSPAMLALLAKRVRAVGASSRLTSVEGDAIGVLADSCDRVMAFDHVCTHFFLDCLSTQEVERLVAGVRARLGPGAVWVVSEFATPSWWTRLVVALLYRGFALLAGLRTQQLPDWRRPLERGGFVCESETRMLGGLVTSSAWVLKGPL